MNKKKSNKNLIILLSILAISGGYLYFSNNFKSDGLVAKAQGSALGVVGENTNTGTLNAKINEDISFLSTLASLKKIRIDTSLFSSDIFKRLENNAVRIEPITPGRINPFAPIDESKIIQATQAPRVVTNQATSVLDTSVILNGTINTSTGVTDTYFEYGLTETLGQSTIVAKPQSLVGAFTKNVTGLNSKTIYYFKACAKINGASVCGDINSFTTK